MRLLILATLGGAIGSGARHLVNISLTRALGPAFPWATLTVNVVGSFLMGFLVDMIMRRFGGSPEMRTFLATGILGGFTTFSAFSLDISTLLARDEILTALIYILASVAISLLALYAGLALSRALFA
jgi:fluoride exporter